MIKVNGIKVTIGHFPDNSLLFKYNTPARIHEITWLYENDEEQVILYYLVKHLNRFGFKEISLVLPYIPNARMDRVKNREDVFTLKYFAEFINSLNFSVVKVLDPHSNVSEALIQNIELMNIGNFINNNVLTDEHNCVKYDCLFFPDEGAVKRYSSLFNIPFIYGQKDRDWKTGEIKGLNIVGEVEKGKSYLIIDDICSRGGTFFHSASKLKELGAGDISLYVSHCENTILEGDLIKSGLLKKVYTTNSIFTKSHELIEIVYKF